MGTFEDSYVGQLRSLIGSRTLITPAVLAVIYNPAGEVLLIRRSDNGQWNLPAGGVELGDSALTCLVREVREETGLEVLAATPVGLYTEPRFSYTNFFGNSHQMFTLVFRVDQWQGTLVQETDETTAARFFPLDQLPDLPAHHVETLQDTQNFNGRFILK